MLQSSSWNDEICSWNDVVFFVATAEAALKSQPLHTFKPAS